MREITLKAFARRFFGTAVVVIHVLPSTSAWEARVRRGMVITSVDGERVGTLDEFNEAVKNAGEEAEFEYRWLGRTGAILLDRRGPT